MRLVVFSDVHGNLPALNKMLEDAGKADGYICLGDVVNYGPWQNECVSLVTSLPNLVYVAGNHEQDFVKGSYSGTNDVARQFFDFCYNNFTELSILRELPEIYKLNGYTFRHTILNQNIYPDSAVVLDGNYVIGHSHHQFWLEQLPFRLYNSGSVGQNRKYLNVINYIVLETNGMKFELRAVKYNPQTVMDEMRKRGYPKPCLSYYEGKAYFQGNPSPPQKPGTIL